MNDFDPHDIYSLINALVGLACFAWTLRYALTKANGKKPIRIVSSAVIFFFAVVYGLDVLGIIQASIVGPDIIRPFLPVLYFIPVWESMTDIPHEKKDTDHRRGGNE